MDSQVNNSSASASEDAVLDNTASEEVMGSAVAPDENPSDGDSRDDAPVSPEMLAALKEKTDQVLARQREQADQLENRIVEQLEGLTDELTANLADEQSKLTEQAREEAEASFTEERESWEAVRDQVEGELQARELKLQTAQQDLKTLRSELETERADLDEWAGKLADERMELETLRRELKDAEENQRRQAAELQDAVASGDTDKAVAELSTQVKQATEERDQLASERDQLTAALTELANELESARNQNNSVNSELQEKFDLALADVAAQRKQISELEQEIESRPSADGQESAELIKLRSERQELMECVEQLKLRAESAAPAEEDSEAWADLQQRFELAVEDVRQLKTENAELEARLEALPTGGSIDLGGQDWESQKRRMLASLEGEDTPTPQQAEERATIEGTIRITDEVIAERDRQIASLLQQLEQGAPMLVEPESIADDDERLEAERNRLQVLEAQWEEKLRVAELELSVERAKIARERAELNDLRADIDSLRSSLPQADQLTEGEANAPQRRWLKKLGLGGDGSSDK